MIILVLLYIIFCSSITISIFIINKFLINLYKCVFYYFPNLKCTTNPHTLIFLTHQHIKNNQFNISQQLIIVCWFKWKYWLKLKISFKKNTHIGSVLLNMLHWTRYVIKHHKLYFSYQNCRWLKQIILLQNKCLFHVYMV